MKNKCDGLFCEHEVEGEDRYCANCTYAMMAYQWPELFREVDEDESLG